MSASSAFVPEIIRPRYLKLDTKLSNTPLTLNCGNEASSTLEQFLGLKTIQTDFLVFSSMLICLQCFDAVGWAAGFMPVKKLSGGVLAWLSVWSEVQTCICPS